MSKYKKDLNAYKFQIKKIYKKNSWSRKSIITPSLINKALFVHNGKSLKFLIFKKEMIGFKIGEFIRTRTIYNFSKSKVKSKVKSKIKNK